MMTETQQAPARPRFRVRKVATDRPWMWLAAGWQDMRAYPYISGAYGAALAIFGWFVLLLMFEFGLTWAILPTVAGFLIVSPLLGAGLYEVSRKRALGEPVTLQLEHKNGNRTDNRLENLELLCALCHSQTSTYGGKNTSNARAKRKWIEDVDMSHL